MNLDPTVDLLLRLAFGLLFVGALAHKLLNWSEFLGVSSSYTQGVLPKTARYLVAAAVVTMESAVVLACALAPSTFAGYAVILVLSVYALAMSLNIMRGNELLDCGCSWGDSTQPVTRSLVIRNVGLIIVAGALLLPEGARSMAAVEYFGVLCALLLAVLVYMTSNLLIANTTDMAGTE